MQLLDLTLPSVAANLAVDEALLETTASDPNAEWLRFWELPDAAVILGRSSRRDDEVHVEQCRAGNVPIARRCSGGLTVLGGPGCLMYSVVLNAEKHPFVQSIDAIHREVLDRVQAAFAQLGLSVQHCGTSDMALAGRKFSGNSLRCKREGALYHGTLLYDFPLKRITELLKMPSRQPNYRQQRSHEDFLTNVAVDADDWKVAFAGQWTDVSPADDWPVERVDALVAERYSKTAWNERP